MQEKFNESLAQATKAFQTADHLTYVTFPLIKEKRLLLRVLTELNASVLNTINSILQYEFYYKRIQIYNDARENFRTFQRIAPRYNISEEQLKRVSDIISLAEKHKKSPFEFIKNDKIIMMSDSNQAETITLERIKSLLIEAKDLLKKAGLRINEHKV